MNRKPIESALCKDLKTGVLLVHGLTGAPSELRPVAKYLTQMGCIVECPLVPGHGGSHKDLLATGWKDWIAGVKAALDRLSEQCDHVVIGGLSMGALLSAMACLNNPKVSGLIMMSTTLSYDGRASSPLQVLLPLVDWVPFLGTHTYWTEEPPYGLKDERLQRMITKQVEAVKRGESADFGLFRTYSGSLRQLHKLVHQVRKRAGDITVPALIIHSLEDSMTTYKNAIEMCSLLGSQEKDLVLLGGCDHVITLDLRKREVANQVGNFVCQQSWRAAEKLGRKSVATPEAVTV